MVAGAANHVGATKLAGLPRSLLQGRRGIVRFSVDDVLAMMRQKILPEDSTTELLNGVVVHKDRSDTGGDWRMHGPKHRYCVRRLTVLAGRVETSQRHAQIQLPLVCGPDQMPEPDFALLRGADQDYAGRLPMATDAFIVMEASDSSLECDVEDKLPIYAAAGIPQYVILNLRNLTIQLYREPDAASASYPPPEIFTRDQVFSLKAGPDGPIDVIVSDLLPL